MKYCVPAYGAINTTKHLTMPLLVTEGKEEEGLSLGMIEYHD